MDIKTKKKKRWHSYYSIT